MKKHLIVLLPVAAFLLMLTAFQPTQTTEANFLPGDDFSIPDDVSAILDKSCFGCHNVDAKSDKSKDKLMIDKLGKLSKAKLVGKLGEISEVVEKNEMPPEKFLAKYPDKALTEDEAKVLKDWADETAEALMK